METIDITQKAKRIIKYGLVGLIALSTAVGGAAFNYQHRNDELKIDNARVAGTMVSVRVLTNGKVKELTKADGDTVKAGDVIAKIEVSVTEEQITQLENAVDMAKRNYAQLEVGQMVKVPIRKPKVKTVQVPGSTSGTRRRSSGSSVNSSANLAALEERKNRMELLFEMGAISRKEMEAAVREYELAKAAGGSSYSSEPETGAEDVPTTTQEVVEYEIEYVDQLQPTPPEILNGAKLAIKQAELSLNVAKQEAQQTEVTAPVDGTIYYSVDLNDEMKAGDIVARVGDSNELWLEAEVTESQFDRISLGKLVSYVIEGNKLTGTVIEKIAPSNEDEMALETVESLESPLPSDATAPVGTPANISDNPAQNPTSAENPQAVGNPSSAENPQPIENSEAVTTSMRIVHTGVGGPISSIKIAQAPTTEPTPEPSAISDATTNAATPVDAATSAENPAAPTPKSADNSEVPTATNADNSVATEAIEGMPIDETQNPAHKDKHIIKISLPAERKFECKPNTKVSVIVKL